MNQTIHLPPEQLTWTDSRALDSVDPRHGAGEDYLHDEDQVRTWLSDL